MKSARIGIVMDPIAGITPAKDSSLAMLLEAQQRGHALHYFELDDLRVLNGEPRGISRSLTVRDSADDWFTLGEPEDMPLQQLDAILMRKDPPFNMEYVYSTYILELAANAGVLVMPDTLARARAAGADPIAQLEGNDAWSVFDAASDLVQTGPTLTNVNDFRAILVAPD